MENWQIYVFRVWQENHSPLKRRYLKFWQSGCLPHYGQFCQWWDGIGNIKIIEIICINEIYILNNI